MRTFTTDNLTAALSALPTFFIFEFNVAFPPNLHKIEDFAPTRTHARNRRTGIKLGFCQGAT